MFRVLTYVCAGLGGLLFVILLVKIAIIGGSSPDVDVMMLKLTYEYHDSGQGLLIWAFVLLIVTQAFTRLYVFYILNGCTKWFTEKNIHCKSCLRYIEKTFGNLSKRKHSHIFMKQSAYMSENKNEAKFKYIDGILQFASQVGQRIWEYLLFDRLVVNAYKLVGNTNVLNALNFIFNFPAWWICLVIWLTLAIAAMVYETIFNNKVKAWLNSD